MMHIYMSYYPLHRTEPIQSLTGKRISFCEKMDMRFVKQPTNIHVTANRMFDDDDVRSRKHGSLLPCSIRCVICGPSNCGKTNVMISLLESPNGLRFENVYVYSKSLCQPKYRYLNELLSRVHDVGYFAFSDNAEVISPADARPNSIFIFDDVACDDQDTMREYFAMGRHSHVDCFYLSQSYARIPKHLIRDNANLMILFQQDATNLRHVYHDHVNVDMSFDKFNELCAKCWQAKYGFIVIDKDSSQGQGRYRRGFNEFVVIS